MATFGDPAVERILALVLDRTGLRLARSRAREAAASVRRAMDRAGYRDPEQYLQVLQTRKLSLDGLVAELTVRETYFFRDAAQFDFVHRFVLPEVLARRGRGYGVRAWSAGCASGEEAYSLAMVLETAKIPGVILGTDIAQDALRVAREAVYNRWSLRALDDAQTAHWFRPAGKRWRLDDGIRRRVSFASHNLLRDPYPLLPTGIWGMDVIFCRNVLIYFDASDLERVARGLHDSLADGGWLITGPSDPSLGGLGSLRAVTTEAGIIYRRSSGEVTIHPGSTPSPSVLQWVEPGPAPAPSSFPSVPATLAPFEPAQQAFAAGDYERVRVLLHDAEDEASVILYLEALANRGESEEALRHAQTMTRALPLSTRLQFMQAILLIDSGRLEDAARALRRVLYLDASSVIAHFVLGAVLRRQNKPDAASRAYRNARDLARALPYEETLDLGEGVRAGSLADLAEEALALLKETGGAS
jgi:chemotaxis protein methyltransferase CheR